MTVEEPARRQQQQNDKLASMPLPPPPGTSSGLQSVVESHSGSNRCGDPVNECLWLGDFRGFAGSHQHLSYQSSGVFHNTAHGDDIASVSETHSLP